MPKLVLLVTALTMMATAKPIRVFVWTTHGPDLRACLVDELAKIPDVEIVKLNPDFSLTVETAKGPTVIVASMLLTLMASGGSDLARGFMPTATPEDVDGMGKLLSTLGVTEVHTVLVAESIGAACSRIVSLADAIGFERHRKLCKDVEPGICLLEMMGARRVIQPSTAPALPPNGGILPPPYVGPAPWRQKN